MRRTFADALKNGNIDIENEYSKLFELFYAPDPRDGKSFANIIEDNFLEYPEFIRNTCLSFDEFNRVNGFRFELSPRNFNVDYLVNFAEYTYNLIANLDRRFFFNNSVIINHIDLIMERIGYIKTKERNFVIFVPRDASAISVAESELIPDYVSYKVIAYNHASKKGNLEEKKVILIKLAEILEPQEPVLKGINKDFSSNLFMLLNNCHIRHNNTEESFPKTYSRYIDELSPENLEFVYDEIYQLCLYAFMQIEYKNRKEWVKDLIDKIGNTK